MSEEFYKLISEIKSRIGAPAPLVQEIQVELGVVLPKDYITFIIESNGAEGFLGDAYVVLWQIQELIPMNRAYRVHDFAPGLLLFGSDGGNEAYAFDTRVADMPVVSVPFVGMDLTEIKILNKTFTGFLEYLYNSLP